MWDGLLSDYILRSGSQHLHREQATPLHLSFRVFAWYSLSDNEAHLKNPRGEGVAY